MIDKYHAIFNNLAIGKISFANYQAEIECVPQFYHNELLKAHIDYTYGLFKAIYKQENKSHGS